MANHPHDKTRPESKQVLAALALCDDADSDSALKDAIETLYRALSPRQRAFAKEYVIDFNGAAAAIRAGYSKKWADRQANILKNHLGVARLIEYYTASASAKMMSIDPDYVIARVTRIINSDEAKDGDKLRGLELLARHLGMFIDRQEITGKDGDAIRIQQQKVREEADDFIATLRRMAKKSNGKKDVTLLG